jgi:hypothetical protein
VDSFGENFVADVDVNWQTGSPPDWKVFALQEHFKAVRFRAFESTAEVYYRFYRMNSGEC